MLFVSVILTFLQTFYLRFIDTVLNAFGWNFWLFGLGACLVYWAFQSIYTILILAHLFCDQCCVLLTIITRVIPSVTTGVLCSFQWSLARQSFLLFYHFTVVGLIRVSSASDVMWFVTFMFETQVNALLLWVNPIVVDEWTDSDSYIILICQFFKQIGQSQQLSVVGIFVPADSRQGILRLHIIRHWGIINDNNIFHIATKSAQVLNISILATFTKKGAVLTEKLLTTQVIRVKL